MAKLSGNRPEAPVARRSVEALAEAAGTPDWLLAATKSYMRWAQGQEVTVKEYTDAVALTADVPIGYGNSWSK